MNNVPYPWQEKQWTQVIASWKEQRLPHALLFSGIAGLGQYDFAFQLAKTFLCLAPEKEMACGVCRRCQLIQAGNYTELYSLQPESAGKVIRIDPIRQLIEQLAHVPQLGPRKIAIIYPAESLHVAAVNALLKTLEEPPLGTLIILVSHQPGRLPATIRSRCQTVIFTPPEDTQWLEQACPEPVDIRLLNQLAEAAPFQALAWRERLPQRKILWDGLNSLSQDKINPVVLAGQWSTIVIHDVLDILLSLIRDVVQLKLGVLDAIVNRDYVTFLQGVALSFSWIHLYAYLDKLYAYRRLQTTSTQLNLTLLYEDLLINWYEYTRRTKF